MRLGLLLVFAAIPFLEIAVMIKVGQGIGFWPTLMLLVVSAMAGTYVIYEQGFQVLQRTMDAVNRGRPPMGPVLDGFFILMAGLLLIVPGFLSDLLGLALLVPPLRRQFAGWCFRQLLKSGDVRAAKVGPASNAEKRAPDHERRASTPPRADGPVIDGEFHHVGDRTVPPGRRGDPPSDQN
jgi:UPF0716 protein FxsA